MGFLFIFFLLDSWISSIKYSDASKEKCIWKISLVEKGWKTACRAEDKIRIWWWLWSVAFGFFIFSLYYSRDVSAAEFQKTHQQRGSFLLVLTPTPLNLNLLAKQIFIPICGIYKDMDLCNATHWGTFLKETSVWRT